MKHLFLILLGVFLHSASYAQRTFTIDINNAKYSLSEEKLNTAFNNVFSLMVQNGITKEKYFDLWVKTYSNWKDRIHTGEIFYETMGNRITKIGTIGNLTNEYKGINADYSNPKGSPHKEDNVAMRMSILNYYLPKELIYALTGQSIIN